MGDILNREFGGNACILHGAFSLISGFPVKSFTEEYSGQCQTSKVKLFGKIVLYLKMVIDLVKNMPY